MNRYRAMTYVLVVSNIIMLVAMFIAAFWGFTYPKIVVDGYESGKSAFVAAFMCCLAGICLCGLNFQNYYLLVTYAILHILIMLNQLFSLLPFTWTRIPNYPLTGSVSTQVYVMLLPKLLLVTFAFALAYKLRRDEKRYELARTGGLHQRLPCHIVPRGAANDPNVGMVGAMGVSGAARCQSAPLNTAGTLYGGQVDHRTPGYGTNDRSAAVISSNNQMVVGGGGGAGGVGGQPPPHLNPLRMIPPSGQPPPPTIGSTSSSIGQTLPPPPTLPSSSTTSTNQIIQTPPIYPLHRPSVTDVSIINSPMVAPSSAICHRPIPVPANCPPQTSHHAPSSIRIGNHSTSCGGLNDISMLHNDQQTIDNQLSRIPGSGRSSVIHWRNNPYQSATIGGGSGGGIAPMTPTKQWWPNSAKQQQYSPYYRDVYNPNF